MNDKPRNYKQELELFMIGALLQGKKIPPDKCISSDRPDIIIPISDNKSIGVEVVTYRSGNNAECEAALDKVLQEYGNKIDLEDNKKYDVTVLFHGAELPTTLNYKTIKETLFLEMDRCRFNHPDKIFNEYISSVHLYEIPGLDKTFVGLSSAFSYNQVNNNTLSELISKKGKKLKQYKMLKQNDVITEWWLVIFFPTIEHTDFTTWNADNFTVISDYDHIYLTELGSNYKEIK